MSESDAATTAVEPRASARGRGGSPEAARTAWTPYTSAIAKRQRPLWIEASKRAAVAAAVALLLAWLDRRVMAGFVALVALTLVALAAVVPSAYRALDRFVSRASWLVGRVLAYVLLTPVFFLVITPLRLLLRSGGRARWGSGKAPAAPSHWKPRARGAPRLDRPF
ncbi:MAG: hypothetical protein K1X94_13070 [Sandaracinaceae bacterium]|nr:hypothetical protein [Sandaracinaceae bacterium]